MEKSGVLDSKVFSGFGSKEDGSTDPTARLKALVKDQYKIDERKDRKRMLQRGGNPALLAVGLPVVGALATELVKDIYHLIKRKVFGGQLNHKTIKNQKDFIKDFVNNF